MKRLDFLRRLAVVPVAAALPSKPEEEADTPEHVGTSQGQPSALPGGASSTRAVQLRLERRMVGVRVSAQYVHDFGGLNKHPPWYGLPADAVLIFCVWEHDRDIWYLGWGHEDFKSQPPFVELELVDWQGYRRFPVRNDQGKFITISAYTEQFQRATRSATLDLQKLGYQFGQ